MTFTSATTGVGSCVHTNGVVNCGLGDLNPGQNVTITIQGTVATNASGDLRNRATIGGRGYDTAVANNSLFAGPALNARADLTVALIGPASVIAGRELTYTVRLDNAGPSTASGSRLTLLLPNGGADYVEATGLACTPLRAFTDVVEIECATGNLLPGTTASGALRFAVRPEMRGTLAAQLSGTSRITDDTPVDNSAALMTTIDEVADLTVALQGPSRVFQPAARVATYSYNIALSNAGPSVAHNARATLTLPGRVTFFSGSAGCTLVGTDVVCTAGALPVGEALDFTVTVEVAFDIPDLTGLTASIVALSESNDPRAIDNSGDTFTMVGRQLAFNEADLELVQTAPATSDAGDTVVFEVVLRNSGGAETPATMTTTLDPGIIYNPSLSDPACAETIDGSGIVECAIASIAIGQVLTFALAGTIGAGIAEGTELRSVAAVVGDATDPDADNNKSIASTTVTTSADLLLTQETSLVAVAAGETVTVTHTIENLGPSLATGIVLTNAQPAGMVLESVESEHGTCEIAAAVVTCALADLAVGDVAIVAIALLAGSGEVTNIASVAATTRDRDESNNIAEATIDVAAAERTTQTFGSLDITADTFIDLESGAVQAFGNVWLGEFIYLAGDTDSVIIDGETIVGEGTVAYLQERITLFSGDFEGTADDETAEIVPAADVAYMLVEIADFPVAGLSIDRVDLLAGRTIGSADEFEVGTEGFEQTLAINLFLDPGPVYGGAVEAFSFDVSGVTIDVENGEIFTEGVRAELVKVTLPEEWGGHEAEVQELEITVDGVSIGGASATFNLPDFELSGEEVQLLETTVTIIYNGENLQLIGETTLAIDLPDNVQESQISFAIDSDGNLEAGLDRVTLLLAGSSLDLEDVLVNNDGLSVGEAVLTLPESLNESTVTVREVTISADGIEIGGAEVVINLPDAELGSGGKARLSELSITLAIEGDSYSFGVAAVLQLRLPQNAQDIRVTAEIDNAGEFSGSIDQLTLVIAGARLQMVNVAFDTNALEVERAELQLPARLGGVTGFVDDIRINGSGLTIGGGGAEFPFPDFKLGSGGFSVTEASAQIAFSVDRTYKLTIAGRVQVAVKNISAMVKGEITYDSQGRFTGRVEDFGISVVGLSLRIVNARVGDGEFAVDQASLKAPASWGGAEITVYNLSISPGRIRIGGGRFALPEIRAGSASLGGLYGEFRDEGNGYIISAGGRFGLPSLGDPRCSLGVGATIFLGASGNAQLSFTADSSWVPVGPSGVIPEGAQPAVAPDTNSITSFQLREVYVGLRSCRIAIGSTGFFLTRVEGRLTLTTNQTIVDLGVSIADGGNIVTGDADMRLQFNPWQIDFAGSITIFSIFKAAELKATARSGYFSADLRVTQIFPPLEGRVSITAWTANGEFNLIGRATLAIQFRKGSVVDLLLVQIPPFDFKLAEIGAEFGKFKKDNSSVWGLKGWASIWGYSAGFYIDQSGGFSVGNVDSYQLISPPSVAAARLLQKGGSLDMLTAEDRAALPADLDKLRAIQVTGDDVVVEQNIAFSTDLMFALGRRTDDGVPGLTLIDPNGVTITPQDRSSSIQVIESPNGSGGTQLVYSIADATPGLWRAVLVGAANVARDQYQFTIIGASPVPTLERVDAMTTGGTTARASWAMASVQPDTTVDVFVSPGPITATHTITGADGALKDLEVPVFSGLPIASNVSTTRDGSLSQADLDLSQLASGMYYVWVNVDDGRNPPTRVYAPNPVYVSHTWQERWSAAFASSSAFRAFDLSWQRHPNPDVDGYRLQIGTELGTVEREIDVGDTDGIPVENLTPGQVYYFTLVGYNQATGRTSTSETISAIAEGASFSLTTAQPTVEVVAGQSVSIPVAVASTVNPYPGIVLLRDASELDGINLTFSATEMTPTVAGATSTVTFATTPSMVGGSYTVVLRGTSDGLQQELPITVVVREPKIVTSASPAAAAITTNDGTTSYTLTAAAEYSATGVVDLDVLDVPVGLVATFSSSTLAPGGSVTLTVADTARLENGVYTLNLRAERGLQQQFIPLTLTVAKPDFRLTPVLSRLNILRGEQAIYAVRVTGENLTAPVTLAMGTASSPIRDALVGVASSPLRQPRPALLFAPDGTAYVIVDTDRDTPAGRYRLLLDGTSGGRARGITLDLTVLDSATTTDLGVTQRPDKNVAVLGDLLTTTIEVANYGPLTAENVALTIALPSATDLVAVMPLRGECTPGTQQVVCNLFSLQRGRTTTVTVTVRPRSSIDLNTLVFQRATVSSSVADQDPVNNVSELTLGTTTRADLAVSVGAPGEAQVAGGQLRYTVTVANRGPSDAAQVVLTSAIPAGMTVAGSQSSQGTCALSADGRALVCALGTLTTRGDTERATVLIVADVASSQVAPLTLETRADARTLDPVIANNSAQAVVRVVRDVNLSITHRVVTPEQGVAGAEIAYQLLVRNTGRSDATNVVVVNTLPAQISAFLGAAASQGSCSRDGVRVTCRLRTLKPGAEATITIRGRVGAGEAVTLMNTATVESDVAETSTTDNLTSKGVTLAARTDLVVSGGAPTPAVQQFIVDNRGPSQATGVVLTGTMSPDLTITSIVASQGTCTVSGQQFTCQLGTMGALDRVFVVVNTTPRPGVFIFESTASVSGGQTEATLDNNTTRIRSTVRSFRQILTLWPR